MSDGPHKSLPLRPRYRQLAEWAYKAAFAIPQVCEAAEAALIRDAAIELNVALPGVVRIVDGGDLLSRHPDFLHEQLRCLRDDAAIQPLAASVIECTQMAIHQGRLGRDAIQEAVATALAERLAANSRATEEHYLVEAGRNACLDIRSRLNETIDAMDKGGAFARMARSILGDATAKVTRAPTVRDGIDEGVSL
ncbi:hypothetical protein ACFFTN_09765 [Aminobacter aganoensis]|uniref:Uncharacterized protein n=1 Tax=Aminobacter aganoensis TaxID=83264 RepID=A0A7X0FBF8_9HYPH|nr:hypothetical protein [Aminobacter aganoensis]MBB6356314.1 hypothetical protein [Aminobacter aganoensis]